MEMIDTDKLIMISLVWDNGNSFVKSWIRRSLFRMDI